LVDVFEYPSSELAQESLLGLTTQFHLPVDLEVNTDDVGDVCIATPDGAWFGFTRGNVLVRVMSGSGTEEPARVVAQLIDTDLIAKPPAAAIPVAAEPFHGGQAVPFSMAAMAKASDEAEEDKPFIKIFSKGGTVTLDHDSTIVPESPEMEIEVFVRQPGGQWIKGLHQPPTTANVEPNVGSRE
jgi:hypothetical protein